MMEPHHLTTPPRRSGVIEPSNIVELYDTSKHPDVIKGTKTPDQVLAEFLETFEVGGGESKHRIGLDRAQEQ